MSSPSLNPGDWYCPRCDYLNFASRQTCGRGGCLFPLRREEQAPAAFRDRMISEKLSELEERIRKLELRKEEKKKKNAFSYFPHEDWQDVLPEQ